MKSLKICGTLMLGVLMLGTGCAQTPTMSASGFSSGLLSRSNVQANVIVDQDITNSSDVNTVQANINKQGRRSSYGYSSSHGGGLIDRSNIQANVIVDQNITNSSDVNTIQANVNATSSRSKKKRYH